MARTPRTRTVTWEDPRAMLARNRARSGLEMAEATIGGAEEDAPIWRLLDYTMLEAREGFAAFACVPAEFHYGALGQAANTVALVLLDSASGRAVNSTLPAGARAITIKLDIDTIAPITLQTGRVRCEAHVVHRGRQIATAEGTLVGDVDGTLYARGRAVFAITGY
jgi:uncharacterized protein (TIGR00369 family)